MLRQHYRKEVSTSKNQLISNLFYELGFKLNLTFFLNHQDLANSFWPRWKTVETLVMQNSTLLEQLRIDTVVASSWETDHWRLFLRCCIEKFILSSFQVNTAFYYFKNISLWYANRDLYGAYECTICKCYSYPKYMVYSKNKKSISLKRGKWNCMTCQILF